MKASNKSRALLLGAAVAVAVTTPALAYYYYAPVVEEEQATAAYGPPIAEPAVTIAEPASTAEPAVAPADPVINAQATTPAPVTTAVQEPPVTVYGERKTKDQLINDDVVKVLAADTRLTGYIGVETRDAIVTLNGRVVTPGQAWHAIRDAQSVEGVREVRNLLMARVGGST